METSNKAIKIDGSKLHIAIVLPYFNEKLGLKLLDSAKKELLANKVKEENISVTRVAGALEIPFACKLLAKTDIDGIITLGAIVKGETDHYEHVCRTTYDGIMAIQLKKNIPIAFGVLTCETEALAKKRLNKGAQAAQALLLQTTI
jgi:6,7-dimethyl-8-ribityllumazine synthase